MAKKSTHPISVCRECINAELHQWIKNPVIAICQSKARFGERFPASVVMRCPSFKNRAEVCGAGEAVIHHHKDYTEGPIAM